MSQRLILPINKCKLTASWKTDSYKNKFGFSHYGTDMVSTAGSATVYASGVGEVVATGFDSVVGNVVAVRYPQAVNRVTGQVSDIVFRYFHLASIAVKLGETVSADTRLGNYGNTGSLPGMAVHLHIEADTDAKHPLYTPTVKRSSLLKGSVEGANDSTMTNPLEWLYLKTDAPDFQTFTTNADKYIRPEDYSLPVHSADVIIEKEIQGIDVSAHNGMIDWQAVKATGKDFVFIRVGWNGWDGRIAANGGLDKRFHDNMKGAIAAGLNVGVYVYSYCKTPEAARIAAIETLELVKPYKLTYPIAFDIEDVSDSGTRYDKMSAAKNSDIVNAFLTEIEQAGYYGMLYTYKSFAENYLNMDALSGWDVWIAQYAAACTYKGKHDIWQHAGDVTGFVGSCPGVTGACDLNVSYKDYAAVIAELGLNRLGDASPPEADKTELERLREENGKLRQDIINLNEKISVLEEKLDKVKHAVA